MASGTGNLPNQGMNFNPFDPLPASQLNDIVENIESVADGTGIGDGAVKSSNIDFATFNQPKVIQHNFGSGTGTRTVTGVGYRPSAVIAVAQQNNITTHAFSSIVFYDGSTAAGARNGSRVLATVGAFTRLGGQLVSSDFSSGNENTMFIATINGFTDDGLEVGVSTNNHVSGQTWMFLFFP